MFDIPAIVAGERSAAALASAGNLAAAQAVLTGLANRFPSVAALHYALTVVFIREHRTDAAIAELERAVESGLPEGLLENDLALAPLRADPGYDRLVASARRGMATQRPVAAVAQPAPVVDGMAPIEPANTAWDPRTMMLRPAFSFPAADPAATTVLSGNDRAALVLNGWYANGTAAGNHGDLYDNRDSGHSSLPAAKFPQLARTRYGAEAKKANLDRGFNTTFLFNDITIGNASLAFTNGPLWRSLPRQALEDPFQVAALFHQYEANQIYVYPEHRDHDPDHGDLIPANTPYLLISQGSSGSDQPLLQAVAAILAAFRPEVKEFLKQKNLVAPTVQWIFRLSQDGVSTDATYLTGKAHPSVFDGAKLNLLTMIQRAHDLSINEVPPMVHLRVIEESKAPAATDIPFLGETLFDTPSAIARIIRSTAYQKRLVIDAGDTVDPNGNPLTFHWSALNGEADIHPLNDSGSRAEIIVPWHERQPIVWQPDLTSDRVDIGVFADNGHHLSAPAFISLLFPANEKRIYRPDLQIGEIDYQDPDYGNRYVDPVLFPARNWRDVFLYDDDGRFAGWKRIRDHSATQYTRDGLLIVETDEIGRPLSAEFTAYSLARRTDGTPEIRETGTGKITTFSYDSPTDLVGRANMSPH